MRIELTRGDRRLVPFALAALAPYASIALPGTTWRPAEVLASLALTLAVLAAMAALERRGAAGWRLTAVLLGYLAALAILRDAGGGADAGVGPMTLLAVFWLALHGAGRHLAAAVCGVLAFYALPVVLLGGHAYPAGGVRGGLLFAAMAAIVGASIQRLVAHEREHAREREDLLARMSELAHTDALTGLPNRRGWDDELDRALRRARREGERLTVALVDVDRFKSFNDEHGHKQGDRLLAGCATQWRAQLRSSDVVARLGGDEFAILLRGCGAADAMRRLAPLVTLGDSGATCSIGVFEWDGAGHAHDLVRAADVALYGAKRAGRGGIRAGAPVPVPAAT
ncbi:MAG: GGDEF domain-containing protein [Vicinamibacteria bacterium]